MLQQREEGSKPNVARCNTEPRVVPCSRYSRRHQGCR
jgi:hypothetical protein